jgi:hypothetical protein
MGGLRELNQKKNINLTMSPPFTKGGIKGGLKSIKKQTDSELLVIISFMYRYAFLFYTCNFIDCLLKLHIFIITKIQTSKILFVN